ncbi:unnamed protein product [Allacma fusca]|uniref:Secreted protein n=1 Tax=Allacma fusca TaxID=39272 RepID=A0A8J2LJ07_9HEXA|nr:unnamed protein product [Allacma fusca]
MAFLKTIQIVLVVIAVGVQSGESRRSRLPPNLCYSEIGLMYETFSTRFQHPLVDATGQKCYKTISKRRLNTMYTKSVMDEAFANASAEVCPDWSNSKKCLFRHLESRCNSTQVERFQEDSLFNYGLTMAQLLCDPPENFNFLTFVKEGAVEDGFGACTGTSDANRELAACMSKSMNGKDFTSVSFQETVRGIHQCYIPLIKSCSQGNTTKEVHLLGLSNQLEQARLASYDAVWDQFKVPASPLLDLQNLLK